MILDPDTPKKRVRLTGARFDGGRLPVDSLVELQRYQQAVRIATAAEWRKESPESELPPDLEGSVSLAIDRIDEGSADVFLVLEHTPLYAQYREAAQNSVDAVIAAAYRGESIPEVAVIKSERGEEFRSIVSEIGQTLGEGQSMEFYVGADGVEPVTITTETRGIAVGNLFDIDSFLLLDEPESTPVGIVNSNSSLIGRITTVDAERHQFVLCLTDESTVSCFYRKNPELLEDIRAIVNPANSGSLTRVFGVLQERNGKTFRMWDANLVEVVEFDSTTWGDRLSALAALREGWDGADAPLVASVALDAAQTLLRGIAERGIASPGVFPTEDGGVLLEWADPLGVSSVEILPGGGFETFSLASGGGEKLAGTTDDLSVALKFIVDEEGV